MVSLSDGDALEVSMVLEDAIMSETGEIGGIEDDLRWASEEYRFHLEHVRKIREGRITKYKSLLERLGFPYEG